MLSKVSIPTLGLIAGSLGFGIGLLGVYSNYVRKKAIMELDLMKNAIERIRQQPNLMELLGGTFEVGKVNLHDGWTKIESDQLRLKVPLNGRDDTAYLFGFAKRSPVDGKPELVKLEITFDKIVGKKIVLMDLDETKSNGKQC